mmetsp:Transcript_130738/g.364329  ORF Transcript_130738/g.364329 Transcript_130738/m.364329 type:complete len:235 (+) Transcript_130738:25-729(+)
MSNKPPSSSFKRPRQSLAFEPEHTRRPNSDGPALWAPYGSHRGNSARHPSHPLGRVADGHNGLAARHKFWHCVLAQEDATLVCLEVFGMRGGLGCKDFAAPVGSHVPQQVLASGAKHGVDSGDLAPRTRLDEPEVHGRGSTATGHAPHSILCKLPRAREDKVRAEAQCGHAEALRCHRARPCRFGTPRPPMRLRSGRATESRRKSVSRPSRRPRRCGARPRAAAVSGQAPSSTR